MRLTVLATAVLLTSACAAIAAEQEFALVHVGATEATFVETRGVKVNGDLVSFQALVVARQGQPQVGGWRQMMVDCVSNEFYRLAVAVVDEAGVPGASEPLTGQPYPVVAGSPEEGMALAVCDKESPFPDRAASIADATRVGRARIEALLK